MLTGTVRANDGFGAADPRGHNPRFAGDNFGQNLAVVDRLGALAHELGLTAAQLALAWLFSRGDDVIPIPGTKRTRNLEENAVAAGVPLSATNLARVEQIAPKGVAAGARSNDPITIAPR